MDRTHAGLKSYLKSELVIDLDAAESQEQLLAIVVERLKAEGALKDAYAARDELLRREAAGSTAVGSGVALPHAVVSESLDRIAVAVVRLKRGINWHAPDGHPVRLLVVILASAQQRGEYLTLLGEVARGLQRAPARDALFKARTAQRVVELLEQPHAPGRLRRSVPLLLLLAGIAVVYVAGRLLYPALRLPETGIYQQLGYVKFNAQPWLANQALTTAIFFGMILGTLLFWRFRVAIAATSFGLLLFFRVMNIEHAVEYMSLPTVIFIMAMMALIKWLENVGVFKFIVLKVVQRVGSSPPVLLVVLMAFSVLLSGFAGEVSGILVTFGLALELARRTKTPVMPYLLSLVFATNVGSALTLVGNPIGVYIAFAGGLTFESFLRWATPLALISGVSVAAACLLVFRRQLHVPKANRIDPASLSSDTFKTHELRLGLGVFTAIVAAIIFHARLEQLLRVGEGTMLMVVPLAALAFVIFVEQERGKMLIERGIDLSLIHI